MNTGKSKKSAVIMTALMLACIGVFNAPDMKAAVDKAQPASDLAHDQNESLMMRVIQMERAQHETGMGVQRNKILPDQPAE